MRSITIAALGLSTALIAGTAAAQDYYVGDQPAQTGQYYNYSPNWGFGAPAQPSAQNNIGGCQARFRSFDPASGTYLGFDGARHSCP
jgi:hypothetical protein